MNCDDFEARLNELLDRRESPWMDAVLVAHSRDCANCRELFASYQTLIKGTRESAAPQPPGDLTERILARLAVSAVAPAAKDSGQRSWAVVFAVAAGLLLGVSLFALNRFNPGSSQTAAKSRAGSKLAIPQSALEGSSSAGQASTERTERVAGSSPSAPAAGAGRQSEGFTELALLLPGGSTTTKGGQTEQSGWAIQLAEGLRPLTQRTHGAMDALFDALVESE